MKTIRLVLITLVLFPLSGLTKPSVKPPIVPSAFEEVKTVKMISSSSPRFSDEYGYLQTKIIFTLVSGKIEFQFATDLYCEKNPLAFQVNNSPIVQFVFLDKIKNMTKQPDGLWQINLNDSSNFSGSWRLNQPLSFIRDNDSPHVFQIGPNKKSSVIMISDILSIDFSVAKIAPQKPFDYLYHGGPITILLKDNTTLKTDEGHIVDFCDLRKDPSIPKIEKPKKYRRRPIEYIRQFSSLVNKNDGLDWSFKTLPNFTHINTSFFELVPCYMIDSIEFTGNYSHLWKNSREIILKYRFDDKKVVKTNLYLESDSMQDFLNSSRNPANDLLVGQTSYGQFAVRLDNVKKITFELP